MSYGWYCIQYSICTCINFKCLQDHHPIENKDDKNHSAGSIDKTLISGEKETEESTKQEVNPEESGEEDSGDLVLSHHEVMVKVQSTLSDIISVRTIMTFQCSDVDKSFLIKFC